MPPDELSHLAVMQVARQIRLRAKFCNFAMPAQDQELDRPSPNNDDNNNEERTQKWFR